MDTVQQRLENQSGLRRDQHQRGEIWEVLPLSQHMETVSQRSEKLYLVLAAKPGSLRVTQEVRVLKA